MILLLSLLKVRYWLTFFYLIEKKNCLMDILRNLSQRFTEDVLMVLLLFSKRHVLFERTWNLASKILSKILFHSLVWKSVDGDIILFNYRFYEWVWVLHLNEYFISVTTQRSSLRQLLESITFSFSKLSNPIYYVLFLIHIKVDHIVAMRQKSKNFSSLSSISSGNYEHQGRYESLSYRLTP